MARSSVPAVRGDTRKKLRSLIRKSPWRYASSARFKDAAHSYIIYFWKPASWKWFASIIRRHGVYRSWRGCRYKYLLLDGDCFWIDWPALNRAKADTLDSTE